ncbi:MAG: hypothetical protein A4E71_01301 [Smithella sp. PtaU1.Bin162]|nr:MAG: hypothetical protein A4E71_01301 [Smithella sp. PtaU1.Bin162]
MGVGCCFAHLIGLGEHVAIGVIGIGNGAVVGICYLGQVAFKIVFIDCGIAQRIGFCCFDRIGGIVDICPGAAVLFGKGGSAHLVIVHGSGFVLRVGGG